MMSGDAQETLRSRGSTHSHTTVPWILRSRAGNGVVFVYMFPTLNMMGHGSHIRIGDQKWLKLVEMVKN